MPLVKIIPVVLLLLSESANTSLRPHQQWRSRLSGWLWSLWWWFLVAHFVPHSAGSKAAISALSMEQQILVITSWDPKERPVLCTAMPSQKGLCSFHRRLIHKYTNLQVWSIRLLQAWISTLSQHTLGNSENCDGVPLLDKEIGINAILQISLHGDLLLWIWAQRQKGFTSFK